MFTTIELTEQVNKRGNGGNSVWGAGIPIDIGIVVELTTLIPVKRFPSETIARARRRARKNFKMSTQDKRDSEVWRKILSERECFYCGEIKDRMEIEHYFPLAKGGTDHTWNLYSACKECNYSKGTQCGTKFLLRTK